ncbi:head maturation protease, ClpP-related [Brevibacillus brevis]|uniref:head maturation protease, ClpP-related n=1 Tax=Brevibacillus brevis TaxID=1393 RepID=UPI00165D5AEF|nr:head maturation protease, ClpP-related [Brevibacillus brevis]
MPKRIEVRGVIIPNDHQWIYDLFEMDATSPGKISKAIAEANGDDLEVIINSGGGDVYSGSEIYTMLKSHPSGVDVQIVGVAASAASVASMGGKRVRMSPTAQFMIHNAKTRTQGDKWEHRHTADFLQAVDKSIANAYRLKTGLSQNELSTLMNRETWMTPQEALAKGFIDEIMFDESNQLSAVAHAGIEMIPQQVIDRVRNEIMKFQTEGASIMQVTNQTQVIDPQPPTASNAAPQPPAPNQTQNTQDAAAQERERLRAIDAIAANIDPALVNEAKYGESPMTAADLALKAMQEGKMINNGLFNAAVAANQASGALDVTAQSQQQNTEKEYDLNNLKDVNAVFQQLAHAHSMQRVQR